MSNNFETAFHRVFPPFAAAGFEGSHANIINNIILLMEAAESIRAFSGEEKRGFVLFAAKKIFKDEATHRLIDAIGPAVIEGVIAATKGLVRINKRKWFGRCCRS